MRNYLASISSAVFILLWSGSQVMAMDVNICSGQFPVDHLLNAPSQSHQDPYPGSSCLIAQSQLGNYGKLPKEQWDKDRRLQMEQVERIKKWDEYGKVRRCKGSCYETYRTCSRRLWDPRSQSCQRDFDNCILACE